MNHKTTTTAYISEADDQMVVVTEERTCSLDLFVFANGWTPGRRPLISTPPDGLCIPAAAPKPGKVRTINKLIEDIRSDQPPELPKGIREKHYRDPALPNLYIRVLNTGVATWIVQWKRLGQQKKIKLGNVKVLDRLKAIEAARALLAKVELRVFDPHEARRERMRANKVTFKTVAPLFLEYKKREGVRPRTENQWEGYFKTGYYFQQLHDLPIDEITGNQIQTLIDTITDQSGKGAARSAFVALRVFFKWALKTDKFPEGHHNPMTNLQAPPKGSRRKRVLTDDEIRVIWPILEAWEAEAIHAQHIMASTGKRSRSGSPTTVDTPRAAMLLFHTGCRRQEIGDLQWPEVDLDNAELFIPGSRRKSRKSKEDEMGLCVPLTDGAVKILRRVERRPDRENVFGYTKRPGLDLCNLIQKIDQRIKNAGGTPPKNWRIHDIRRTVRTRLAALGVSRDVAEALIGHVGFRNEMERTYNLHEYWPEKRKALAMWEANLRAIIDGTAEKISAPTFGQRKKENSA